MENSKNQRVCKRCLLRESNEQDYHDRLEQYILAIDQRERTDSAEYRKRLTVCKECDKLLQGTCLACGCYVELRAASAAAHCPKKKW